MQPECFAMNLQINNLNENWDGERERKPEIFDRPEIFSPNQECFL